MRSEAAAPRLSSPVGRLLRTFSWQELRHHGLRHSTAVLAVLLGVALAFAVHLINASALSEFSAAVRSVNGQADLSLRAAHGTLDETLYPKVAQRPEVAVANPVIEQQTQARVVHAATASASSSTQTAPVSLRVLGLDPLVAGSLTPLLVPRLATDVPGLDRLGLFAPDSMSLNAAAQRQLGVQPGDTIAVQAGLRWVTLRVVGTVSAGGAPLGVMDLAGAQDTFGLHGQLSRLDVQLQGGAQPDTLLKTLALPPGVIADSAEAATQRVSNVSRAYRVNLTVLALVALFTGAFLVFSILALSVAKRQQQFALLGVLGLSGRERLQLVLWESAVIGLLGSARCWAWPWARAWRPPPFNCWPATWGAATSRVSRPPCNGRRAPRWYTAPWAWSPPSWAACYRPAPRSGWRRRKRSKAWAMRLRVATSSGSARCSCWSGWGWRNCPP